MNDRSNLLSLDCDSFKRFSEIFTRELIGEKIEINKFDSINIEDAKSELKSIFLSIVYDGQDNPHFRSYGEDRCNIINEIYDSRKVEIVSRLLKEHNSRIMPVMEDFDWKLKWVLGSSSSVNMRYPIVDLTFKTIETKDEKLVRKSIHLELTKDELELLLKTLKSA